MKIQVHFKHNAALSNFLRNRYAETPREIYNLSLDEKVAKIIEIDLGNIVYINLSIIDAIETTP